MKKLFYAIICLAITSASFAQVKVRPGARLGLNSSTFTNTEGTSRKMGVNAALFANIQLASFYQLQPELTYSSQGFKNDDTYNVDYFGVAITNKFFIVPNTGIHVLVGPSIEINIGDDWDNDYITPIDFALFGGIGYEFPFGLGLEARYKHGFIDVRESYNDNFDWDDDNDDWDDNDNYFDDNWLNSAFQFNVYYKFNF